MDFRLNFDNEMSPQKSLKLLVPSFVIIIFMNQSLVEYDAFVALIKYEIKWSSKIIVLILSFKSEKVSKNQFIVYVVC